MSLEFSLFVPWRVLKFSLAMSANPALGVTQPEAKVPTGWQNVGWWWKVREDHTKPSTGAQDGFAKPRGEGQLRQSVPVLPGTQSSSSKMHAACRSGVQHSSGARR